MHACPPPASLHTPPSTHHAAACGRWRSWESPGPVLLRLPLVQVVEQIPGLVMSGDATDRLRLGYFPSYNVPWFKEVREDRQGGWLGGLPPACVLCPEGHAASGCPCGAVRLLPSRTVWCPACVPSRFTRPAATQTSFRALRSGVSTFHAPPTGCPTIRHGSSACDMAQRAKCTAAAAAAAVASISFLVDPPLHATLPSWSTPLTGPPPATADTSGGHLPQGPGAGGQPRGEAVPLKINRQCLVKKVDYKTGEQRCSPSPTRRILPLPPSVKSMAALLRSNNWRHDPLSGACAPAAACAALPSPLWQASARCSQTHGAAGTGCCRPASARCQPFSAPRAPHCPAEGHPIAAICGRGDLDPDNPVPRGCFDTKVGVAARTFFIAGRQPAITIAEALQGLVLRAPWGPRQ